MFKKLDISTKDELTIWFNGKKRKEFYYAPIFRYKTNLTCKKGNYFQSVNLVNNQDYDKIYYSTQEIPNPYEEEFGTLLIRYLNADFSSFETAYYTFFCYYGFSILKKYNESISLTDFFDSKEHFFKTFEPIFQKLKSILIKTQKKYKECVNFIYDIENKAHTEYTTFEKFTSCVLQNNLLKYSENIKILNLSQFNNNVFGLKNTYSNPRQVRQALEIGAVDLENSPIYSSNSIHDIIFISLLECVKNKDLRIARCQNCSKYFISYNKSEKYCNITYFQDEISCKKKGATQFYTKKKQSAEWLKIYRNEYQRRLMQVKRSNDKNLKDDFNSWKKEAKNKLKEYKNNLINKDELFEWLKK